MHFRSFSICVSYCFMALHLGSFIVSSDGPIVASWALKQTTVKAPPRSSLIAELERNINKSELHKPQFMYNTTGHAIETPHGKIEPGAAFVVRARPQGSMHLQLKPEDLRPLPSSIKSKEDLVTRYDGVFSYRAPKASPWRHLDDKTVWEPNLMVYRESDGTIGLYSASQSIDGMWDYTTNRGVQVSTTKSPLTREELHNLMHTPQLVTNTTSAPITSKFGTIDAEEEYFRSAVIGPLGKIGPMPIPPPVRDNSDMPDPSPMLVNRTERPIKTSFFGNILPGDRYIQTEAFGPIPEKSQQAREYRYNSTFWILKPEDIDLHPLFQPGGIQKYLGRESYDSHTGQYRYNTQDGVLISEGQPFMNLPLWSRLSAIQSLQRMKGNGGLVLKGILSPEEHEKLNHVSLYDLATPSTPRPLPENLQHLNSKRFTNIGDVINSYIKEVQPVTNAKWNEIASITHTHRDGTISLTNSQGTPFAAVLIDDPSTYSSLLDPQLVVNSGTIHTHPPPNSLLDHLLQSADNWPLHYNGDKFSPDDLLAFHANGGDNYLSTAHGNVYYYDRQSHKVKLIYRPDTVHGYLSAAAHGFYEVGDERSADFIFNRERLESLLKTP